jgi:DNA polymerase-3 subunit beta
MKIQILQENFSKALLTASRFVNTRATLPVLSNILLKAQGTKIILQATNLESSISTSVGAKVTKEGTITIPARFLAELVSNLPHGPIELVSEKEELSIHTDHFDAVVAGVNPSEFPSVPSQLGDNAIRIPSQTLLKALTQCVFAVSVDESRPILTGLLFILDKSTMVLVGTDGHRLSQKKIPIKHDGESKKVILPKNVITELTRQAVNIDSVCLSFSSAEKQALLGVGEAILTSRVIEGEFPNFERIIPKESRVNVRVNKDEFLRAIKVAGVFARESGYIGKLAIKKGSMEISSESARSGSQKAQVEAKVEGDSLSVVYNLHFVEEFLNIVDGEEVEIQLTDAESPGVFLDTKDPNFLHLIMPVKI